MILHADCEYCETTYARLVEIERILRNGLPVDDRAEAGTIAHAHAEVERLLEDLREARL